MVVMIDDRHVDDASLHLEIPFMAFLCFPLLEGWSLEFLMVLVYGLWNRGLILVVIW